MGTAIGIDVRGRGGPPVGRRRGVRPAPRHRRPVQPVPAGQRGQPAHPRRARRDGPARPTSGRSSACARTCAGRATVRSTSGATEPDGRPDPTGLVKGWAIEEASLVLDAAGATDFTINAGGDIVARGEPEPGRAWRVGIRHPRLADRVAAVLAVRDLAVATSGGYERGDHIVDPRTGRAAARPAEPDRRRPEPDLRRRLRHDRVRPGSRRPGLGRTATPATAPTRSPPTSRSSGRRWSTVSSPDPARPSLDPGSSWRWPSVPAGPGPQASGSTLPGLRIPSGSRASLIARIIATAPSPRWSSR